MSYTNTRRRNDFTVRSDGHPEPALRDEVLHADRHRALRVEREREVVGLLLVCRRPLVALCEAEADQWCWSPLRTIGGASMCLVCVYTK